MKLPPATPDTTDQPCLDFIEMMCKAMFEYGFRAAEAGTHTGHSAMAMARAGGVVHTCDVDDLGVDFSGCSVFFHHMPFEDFDWGEGYLLDAAFIDASGPGHDADMRWDHYQIALEHISPGGLIMVHDTAAHGWTSGTGSDPLGKIRAASDYNIPIGRGISVTLT